MFYCLLLAVNKEIPGQGQECSSITQGGLSMTEFGVHSQSYYKKKHQDSINTEIFQAIQEQKETVNIKHGKSYLKL